MEEDKKYQEMQAKNKEDAKNEVTPKKPYKNVLEPQLGEMRSEYKQLPSSKKQVLKNKKLDTQKQPEPQKPAVEEKQPEPQKPEEEPQPKKMVIKNKITAPIIGAEQRGGNVSSVIYEVIKPPTTVKEDTKEGGDEQSINSSSVNDYIDDDVQLESDAEYGDEDYYQETPEEDSSSESEDDDDSAKK